MLVCLKGHPLVGDNIKQNGRTGKRCCRACDLVRKRLYKERHKHRLNNGRRKWGRTEKGQRWQRDHDYRKKYDGFTLEQYEAMFAEQGGLCAISGLPSPTGRNAKTRLNVDHDHATNTVRQLLHPDINTALGLFQDNPEWLRRAADYIERWKK